MRVERKRSHDHQVRVLAFADDVSQGLKQCESGANAKRIRVEVMRELRERERETEEYCIASY